MNAKCIRIVATIAAAIGGLASAAPASPNNESFKVLCDGTNKLPPIYVAYTRDGAFERLNIVRDEKTGQLRGGYVPVAQEHIDGICAKGQAISAAPKPLSAEGEGTKVYTSYTLPSSFTLATYYGVIFGNFWVPGVMPSGHAAHLATYDVLAYRFSNATGGSHFVNSLLTFADWGAGQHSGKGLIFGDIVEPGISGGVTCYEQSVVTETWHDGNYVWDGKNPSAPAPNTCSPNFYYTGQNYSVLNGANVYQESTYWLFNGGAGSPFFQAPIVYSPHPGFRAGYAGITFLVASAVPTLPFGEYWTLSFTNVFHWTQP